MPGTIDLTFVLEMIGTVAFALSGAMVAIQKRLDLLGILVLGITTAVGGGMIRDLIIGIHPPMMFVKPVYVVVSAIFILILFLIIKVNHSSPKFLESALYETLFNLMDAIGLGVFTVVGVNSVMNNDMNHMLFLKIFLGVITGVGGGLIRDMMANETPGILRKHVYACASIVGAVCYIILYDWLRSGTAMVLSVILVVVIRVLAKHYEWNLPKAL
ncbi:MAG: trimeric intracellular cation channel family protein [Lachnospiraceae bacterium]|nr:trimeric intracellular cation channel family protein [Lacrimispora saccharolytica]